MRVEITDAVIAADGIVAGMKAGAGWGGVRLRWDCAGQYARAEDTASGL